MLINLTNHPSNKWSDKQLDAAIEHWKEITDLAFPQIPPEWNTDQVISCAKEYLLQIKQLIPAQDENAIHLMGEQMFCYYLTQLLLDDGYKVVASTTIRKDYLLPDGKNVKEFNFIQFREYSLNF